MGSGVIYIIPQRIMTMYVSDMMRLGTADLTPQQLADMALAEDQRARRLMKAGADASTTADLIDAFASMIERDRLADLSRARAQVRP